MQPRHRPHDDQPPEDFRELVRRIGLELADSYDEELELEIEDRNPVAGEVPGSTGEHDKEQRRLYF